MSAKNLENCGVINNINFSIIITDEIIFYIVK